MYGQFTGEARKVMQIANHEALRFQHEYLGTEHILLGLLKVHRGVAAHTLKNLGIDYRAALLEYEKFVQFGPGGEQSARGQFPYTPGTKKVIDYAVEEARGLDEKYINTEHLLLGLLHENESVATQILLNLGLKLDVLREEVFKLLGRSPEYTIPKNTFLQRLRELFGWFRGQR